MMTWKKMELMIPKKEFSNYSVDEDSKWNTDDADRTGFYGFNFYLIIFNALLSEQFL